MEIYLINFIIIFLLNTIGFFFLRKIRLILFLELIFLAATYVISIFANEEFRVLLTETYLLKQLVLFSWIFINNFSLRDVKCNLGINVFAIMNLMILILQTFYIVDNPISSLAILMMSCLLFKFITLSYLNLSTIFSLGFISTIILISGNLSYSLYSLDDAILRYFSSFWIIFLFLVIYYLLGLLLHYKTFKLGSISIARDIRNVLSFLSAYVLILSFFQVFVPYNNVLIKQTIIVSILITFLQLRQSFTLRLHIVKKYSLWL